MVRCIFCVFMISRYCCIQYFKKPQVSIFTLIKEFEDQILNLNPGMLRVGIESYKSLEDCKSRMEHLIETDKLTISQKKFYSALNDFFNLFYQNDTIDRSYLGRSSSLHEVITEAHPYISDFGVEHSTIHSALLRKIDGAINNISTLIIDAITPAGISTRINSFFTNDSLCSLSLLRAGLEMSTVSARLFIEPERGIKLDCFIILPHSESADDSERIEMSERLLNALNGRMTEIENELLSVSNKFNSLAEKVIVICQPNAGYYELTALSRSLIDFYLQKETAVILWNYRGYGYSTGCATMCNISSDTKFVVSYIKKILHPKKIAVHGVSLGGHAAKSVSDDVDIIIPDRTFSLISYIPYEMFGGLIQKVYNIFLDDYRDYVHALIESDSKKIILYDPHDGIITLFTSLFVKLTVYLGKVWLNGNYTQPEIIYRGVASPLNKIRCALKGTDEYLQNKRSIAHLAVVVAGGAENIKSLYQSLADIMGLFNSLDLKRTNVADIITLETGFQEIAPTNILNTDKIYSNTLYEEFTINEFEALSEDNFTAISHLIQKVVSILSYLGIAGGLPLVEIFTKFHDSDRIDVFNVIHC